jgi:hypothetical protein
VSPGGARAKFLFSILIRLYLLKGILSHGQFVSERAINSHHH